MESGIKPQKTVYTIVERAKDRRKFWVRVGAAFVNRDGSLNVHLDAMPTNGQLHIRDPQSATEPRRAVAESSAGEPLAA